MEGMNWRDSNIHIDPWMKHAIEVIKHDYGVDVSLQVKNKDLIKYGRNTSVGTSYETLWTCPAANETYLTDNLITHAISSSSSDSEVITIEGHTLSGDNFTFVIQNLTLNGQTAVALTTPLARATRAYDTNGTDLVGTISITESDTYTSGVPDTAAKVHLNIRAGRNQSEKASTTISSADYWVITGFYADMLTKAAGFAEVVLEIRRYGKVFRENLSGSCSDAHRLDLKFQPYIIVPPNSDVRLRAISDSAGGIDISGGIIGALLK